MDILSLIIGALSHDLGHPGVNNAFLVQIQSRIAIKCKIFFNFINIKIMIIQF